MRQIPFCRSKTLKPIILVWVAIAMMSQHHQKKFEGKRVYFAYAWPISEETEDRSSNMIETRWQELIQRPWRVLFTDLFPMTLLKLPLCTIQNLQLGIAPPTVDRALLHQSLMNKVPHWLVYSQTLETLFKWCSLLYSDSNFC